MEIGQRVRTSDSVVIAPNRIGEVVEIGNGNVCLNMQGYGPVWYEAQHLEAIPDDGKQSTATPQPFAQYPLLRAMVGARPLNTWKQVLNSYPLAASQPHLYLLGYYRSDIYDLEQFAKDTPRFILMSTIACSNAKIGGSETQPYHIVFVITEGE